MKNKIAIFVLSFCMTLTACSQSKTNMSTLDKEIIEIVEKDQPSPSFQYYFFDSATIIHSLQHGIINLTENKPVNENATYNFFSITKTFTALSILQLVNSGKVNLDSSASVYLNNFPYSRDITVRHLLTHTSGIPNPIPLSWIHLDSEHSSFNSHVFFRSVFSENPKLKFTPGTKYAYSNLGYVLLGNIIETVSGLTYEQYVKKNIITKLGLSASDLDFIIYNTADHAVGYHPKNTFFYHILGWFINKSKYMDKPVGKWAPFNNIYVNGPSYGGLIGKPKSLVVYLQALLSSNSFIDQNTKKLLFTENQTSSSKKTNMCLSWFKGISNGNTYYTHAGGGGGYYCEIRLYPELGKASVIVFNSSGINDVRVLNKIDALFLK